MVRLQAGFRRRFDDAHHLLLGIGDVVVGSGQELVSESAIWAHARCRAGREETGATMTDVSQPGSTRPEQRYDRDDRYRGGGRRRERGIFISTEARPGFITTEFWLTLLGIAALVILAFAVDEVGDRFGIGCATAALVAYVLSRGIAKAGSSEVVRRDWDDT